MDKVWIDAKDHRERLSHKVCGRQEPMDLDQPFANGLMYPGDPDGPAKEVVNCRCKVAGVPRRDAQGRVIRKPKPMTNAAGHDVRVIDTTPKPSPAGQLISGIVQGVMIGDIIQDIINEDQ